MKFITDTSIEIWGAVAGVAAALPIAWKAGKWAYHTLRDLSSKIDGIPNGEEFQNLTRKVDRGFEKMEGHLAIMDQKIRMNYDLKHVAIFEFDKQGALSWVNSFFTRITGLTLQSALGSGWLNAIHPDERDAVAFEWKAAKEDGRDFIVNHTSFQYIATGTELPAKIVFRVLRGETEADIVGWQGWVFFGESRETEDTPRSLEP